MPVPAQPDRCAAANSRAVTRWLEQKVMESMRGSVADMTAQLRAA